VQAGFLISCGSFQQFVKLAMPGEHLVDVRKFDLAFNLAKEVE
jgi:hypothetical protein